MSKYIDAEKLKTELNKRIELLENGDAHSEVMKRVEGVIQGYKATLSIIGSLQQDQDLIIINKKDWKAQEQFQKNKDFGKPLKQEQQEVDLDADIEMEWDSFNKHLAKYGEESEDVVWLNWNSFDEIAHYFYELGLKARKEK